MAAPSTSQTIVLITGANQGLGFECAKKLAREQENYHIIMCSRKIEKGQQAASSITAFAKHSSVEALELDITSDSSIGQAVKAVESKFGRLDVLFNNAGIATAGEPDLRTEILKVLDTNVVSQIMVTEAFVPLLKKAEVPRLVFMSSGLGSITYTLMPSFPYYGLDSKAYVPSKAALNMVGALYAVKYGKEGFKVNLVDPGFRATNLNNYHEAASKPEDGAIEACRIITQGKDGQHATFTSAEGSHPW